MKSTQISIHNKDFEVHYRFYTIEEGGRRQPACQGYRCDWSYEGDDISKTGGYMIWPEFQNIDGTPIMEGDPVPTSGIAKMWILSPDFRLKIHQHRLKVGVRGYFMEGSRKVAEATVSLILGLHSNCNEV